MKLYYFGHSSFLLEADDGTRVVTDPYGEIGYPFPCGICADVVTVSHSHFDHSNVSAVGGDPLILSKAGEYVHKNVRISAVLRYHDEVRGAKRGGNLIFRICMDGISVCHLGDLGEPFSREVLDRIPHSDVLLVPVGGNYTIGSAEAKKYADALDPAFIIPMHYHIAGGTIDITDPDAFIKLYGGAERMSCLELRAPLSSKGKLIVMEVTHA